MVKEVRFGWDDEFTPPPMDPAWDLDDPDWEDPIPEQRPGRDRSQFGRSGPRCKGRPQPSRDKRKR